jgi:C4-dicarboxylate transporter DctM subunit
MMVVLGVTNNLSIGGLFAAGFLPGALVGFSLMAVAAYYAWKLKHRKYAGSITLRTFTVTTLKAIVPLMIPVIILGGILSGVFTPTEASAMAVAYALIVGLVTRRLTFQALWSAIAESVRITAVVMLIIGTANSLGYVLSFYLIPQKFTAALLGLAGIPSLYLLMSILILLIAGCFLESAAIIVILTPILMAGALNFGLNPLHFGFIMSMALCVGLVTPPLGLCLYVVSSIGKISIEKISKAIFPFILAETVILFCCAYWPGMILFIPKLLGFA